MLMPSLVETEEQQRGLRGWERKRQHLDSFRADHFIPAVPLLLLLVVQSSAILTNLLVWNRISQSLIFLVSHMNSKVHNCCLLQSQLLITESESRNYQYGMQGNGSFSSFLFICSAVGKSCYSPCGYPSSLEQL